MSDDPCNDFFHKLTNNIIEFRKYGGNITVEPVNDLQIQNVFDLDSKIFLYYYFGYLKDKKEARYISMYDINDASINVQNKFLSYDGEIMIVDFAMIRGDIDTLNWLIAIGVNMDDYSRRDMIITSIISNSVDMLLWVIDLQGPSFNMTKFYTGNLLKFALEKRCLYDMIKYLFNYGIPKPILSLDEKEKLEESYDNKELWERIVELLDL